MDLVEKLLPIEKNYFLWLNDHHTPFWDTFMFAYSSKFSWIPLATITLYVFVWKIEWRESLLAVFLMVMVGVVCDQVSASIIKPFFEGLRPTYHPDYKDLVNVVYNYRGGRFGFISTHTANGFGIVVFTAMIFRYKWYTLLSLLWVTVTAYSRIYLGVHFISDIIGGMILGVLVGFVLYGLYILGRYYLLRIPTGKLTQSVIPLHQMRLMMMCIALTILCITFISFGSVF